MRGTQAEFRGKGLVAMMLVAAGLPGAQKAVELVTAMTIDVDGAPNAYGPPGKPALDFERNAHQGGKLSGKVVGYMLKSDGRTPEVQGPGDPFPGYYISSTHFEDEANPNPLDPLRYLDARKINYVVLGRVAERNGVNMGDFVAVYSKATGKSAYGIVGDSGNSSGGEGSLALLQALGYKVRDGKSGGPEQKEIVIRYFPGSNRDHHFFHSQAQIDEEARTLGLDRNFGGGDARESGEAGAIRAARMQSNAALAARDIEAFGRTLGEDFVMIRGNGVLVPSRQAYLDLIGSDFRDEHAVRYERLSDRIEISGAAPLAAEQGHWTGTRPGGARAYGGTYLAMWRKVGQEWKLRSELFVVLSCEDEAACAGYRK